MSKRQFVLTVGAYLTGWVIAQSIFLRVLRHVMRDKRDDDWKKLCDDMAFAVAEKLNEVR